MAASGSEKWLLWKEAKNFLYNIKTSSFAKTANYTQSQMFHRKSAQSVLETWNFIEKVKEHMQDFFLVFNHYVGTKAEFEQIPQINFFSFYFIASWSYSRKRDINSRYSRTNVINLHKANAVEITAFSK